MFEYSRFSGYPSGWVRREKDSTDDWQEVPLEDAQVAEDAYVAGKIDGAMAAQEGKLGAVVTRSEENKARSAKIGLTADELAELLNSPEKNSGTRRRIPEEDFAQLAAELGLPVQEVKDRFAGRFFTQ